ncbi:MAG: hypothetical protein FJ011_05060 [Chloroflexi bacterium]|nr:hypothetical protein [Chloroflexota bacterium]
MSAAQRSQRGRTIRDPLSVLEDVAARDDRHLFIRLAREMRWDTVQAEDLWRAIRLALTLDLAPLAMELAQKGQQIFPDSQQLQQAARVLRPPVVVGTRPAQGDHGEASRAWLSQHSHEYPGQWVAVRNGILLGVSPTLKNLSQQIGPETDTPDTVVVKVLP